MRNILRVSVLLVLASATLSATPPNITGLLTNYPGIPRTVTLRGTTWGPGTAYGPVGTTVTIVGSSFGLDGTVTFAAPPSGTGTVAAAVSSWDDTSIIVTVPTGAVSGVVRVTSNGQSSNPMPFVVTPGPYRPSCGGGTTGGPPVLNTLSPSSGPPGTLVGIRGSGFRQEQGTSTVSMNGIQAFATFWSDNTITFAIPQGATTGPVQVVVAGVGSNTLTFTVTSSSQCVIADGRAPSLWGQGPQPVSNAQLAGALTLSPIPEPAWRSQACILGAAYDPSPPPERLQAVLEASASSVPHFSMEKLLAGNSLEQLRPISVASLGEAQGGCK